MLENRLFRAGVVASAGLAICFVSACSGSPPTRSANSNRPAGNNKVTNSCSLLSETEIAGVVGNSVSKGRNEASTDICKWDTDDPADTDVLLIVREKGGIHEKVLCDDLRNKTSSGEKVAGLGDVAVWKFSHEGLFNTADVEVCGPKGYLTLTLQGKRDEATLKAATLSLAQKILQRL